MSLLHIRIAGLSLHTQLPILRRLGTLGSRPLVTSLMLGIVLIGQGLFDSDCGHISRHLGRTLGCNSAFPAPTHCPLGALAGGPKGSGAMCPLLPAEWCHLWSFFQGWDLGEPSSSHLYGLIQSCQGKFDICWQDQHLWSEGCVPGSLSGFFPVWSGLASRKDWFTSSAVMWLVGTEPRRH